GRDSGEVTFERPAATFSGTCVDEDDEEDEFDDDNGTEAVVEGLTLALVGDATEGAAMLFAETVVSERVWKLEKSSGDGGPISVCAMDLLLFGAAAPRCFRASSTPDS